MHMVMPVDKQFGTVARQDVPQASAIDKPLEILRARGLRRMMNEDDAKCIVKSVKRFRQALQLSCPQHPSRKEGRCRHRARQPDQRKWAASPHKWEPAGFGRPAI